MGALQNLIRVGVVSSVSASRMAVRVTFADKDDMVTDWLPMIVPQTTTNKDFALPTVGDTVVCVFLGNGIESGFCLGSVYSDVDKPPTNNSNKRGVWFSDGSYIEFDAASKTLTVDAKGKVVVKAAIGIEMTGNIQIDGNVKITGNLVVDGSITRGGVPL